jgi:hypothetical protein
MPCVEAKEELRPGKSMRKSAHGRERISDECMRGKE